MNLRKKGLAVFLAAVATGVVQAATLFTPPVEPQPLVLGEGTSVLCWVLNVGSKSGTVRIQIHDTNTNLWKEIETELGPGLTAQLLLDVSDPGPVYCKFEVEGNKNNYRASMCLMQPTGGCLDTIAAQ